MRKTIMAAHADDFIPPYNTHDEQSSSSSRTSHESDTTSRHTLRAPKQQAKQQSRSVVERVETFIELDDEIKSEKAERKKRISELQMSKDEEEAYIQQQMRESNITVIGQIALERKEKPKPITAAMICRTLKDVLLELGIVESAARAIEIVDYVVDRAENSRDVQIVERLRRTRKRSNLQSWRTAK